MEFCSSGFVLFRGYVTSETISCRCLFTLTQTCLCITPRLSTADIARRRFDQHRRVLELRKATSHITPTEDIEDHQWGHVKWYYQQYGDVDGGGNSMALIMKHDIHSDSFAEFIIPKLSLLLLGTVASVLAAASRFPKSVSNATSDRTELNPDRFGSGGKVYVLSCVVQIVVIQIWCLSIVHASFVTGERLRKEPFLSTRPSQLAFRVSVAMSFVWRQFPRLSLT